MSNKIRPLRYADCPNCNNHQKVNNKNDYWLCSECKQWNEIEKRRFRKK